MAGYDDNDGPELFFLDYLASMVKVPFAAHGYGSYFSLGVMDRYYKDGECRTRARIWNVSPESWLYTTVLLEILHFPILTDYLLSFTIAVLFQIWPKMKL